MTDEQRALIYRHFLEGEWIHQEDAVPDMDKHPMEYSGQRGAFRIAE